MRHDKENIMVILSSPSGVGKTTLSKKINQKLQNFKISVSHTTRKPRSNEVDGVDYHFVSKSEFLQMINKNRFYEHAKIFGNFYGTLKDTVDKDIKNNDLLFDIDWQGTKQLSKFEKLNLIKIFLVANNKIELKKRLEKRNQNTNSEIKKRLASFEEDVLHWKDYDYILINESIDVCFNQLKKIINSHKNFNFQIAG